MFNTKNINNMSAYVKIKRAPLTDLNNAEYLTFMNHVLDLAVNGAGTEGGETDSPSEISLAAAGGVPELGLSEEFIGGFEAELVGLADAVDESRVAEETEEMAVHETNRDNLAVYVLTRISRAGTLPLEAERDAGKYLYKKVKPYVGVASLPVAQETAKLRGLLMDLRKAENAPYVTTLGLDAYLSELEKENEAYDRLYQSRLNARAANRKESGTSIRKRVDALYDDLALLAQSYNVVQPTDRSAAFVAALNQLIAETTAAYKQRRAQATGKDEEQPETDSPSVI